LALTVQVVLERPVRARLVVARIRDLDPGAKVVHQDGSHQKWRLTTGASIIVPTHSRDIPTGTLRSIERQGESSFGRGWLRGPGERLS
jgi:predicted RNA binding protein YcfA (HicA-like mRNA interferase family)